MQHNASCLRMVPNNQNTQPQGNHPCSAMATRVIAHVIKIVLPVPVLEAVWLTKVCCSKILCCMNPEDKSGPHKRISLIGGTFWENIIGRE